MERDIGRLNDEHQQMKTDLNDITGRLDSTVEECNELRTRMAENRQKIAEVTNFDKTTVSFSFWGVLFSGTATLYRSSYLFGAFVSYITLYFVCGGYCSTSMYDVL